MKKLYLRITICLFVCLFSTTLQAKEVNKQTAEKIAINAFTQLGYNKNISGFQTKEILTVKTGEKNAFYIVNFNPTGFVILSASDAVTPILGSSAEANFFLENIPPQLSYLFDIYKKQIQEIEEQKINPTEEVKQKWNKYSVDNTSLISSNSLKSATTLPSQVSPLLSTTWNQNAGWNRFCPANASGPGGHCYAGCTAVAFAQVIYYWGCKVNESGTIIDSNYNNLSVNLTNANYSWTNMGTSTSDDNNSLLIYHCAIAAQTIFGASSSPGYIFSAQNALVNNFGFKNSIAQESSSTSGWINKLKEELSLARPMIYEGYGTTLGENGHAWVIDGYDTNDNFHCNWGWGGSSDGYYQINDLHPKNTSYTFNIYNWATLGIEPVMSTCDEINGGSLICSSGASFNVPNLPAGATVSWDKSSNITFDNQPGNPKTFIPNGSGSGWIEATVHYNGNATLERKTVSVGVPILSYITDPTNGSNPFNFYAIPSPNSPTIDNYTWIVTPSGYANIYSWMDHAEITFPEPMCYRVDVQATNACGCSNQVYKYFNYYGDYLMSPNPASTEVEITISSGLEEGMKSASLSSDDEYTVTVLDIYGTVKIQKKYSGNKFTIPVGSLKDGNYIVKVNNKKINSTKQLIVKH